MEENNTLVAQFFQMHNKKLQLKSFDIWVRNYLFLKNYYTSEGTASHTVLYCQQLSITRYQVSFYTILSNNQQCPVPFKTHHKNNLWVNINEVLFISRCS